MFEMCLGRFRCSIELGDFASTKCGVQRTSSTRRCIIYYTILYKMLSTYREV